MTEDEYRELLKAHERNIEDAKEAHSRHRAVTDFANTSAVEFSSHVIKSLTLVNGGAAIAMLGFVGATANNQSRLKLDLPLLIDALSWFAWGVGAAVLTSFFAYLVQYFQAERDNSASFTWEHPYVERGDGHNKLQIVRNIMHLLAVVIAIASMSFFAAGVTSVSAIVSSQFSIEKTESN